MQLEVGKYYKTRDGRKVGPMYKKWDDCEHPWGLEEGIECYSGRGIRWSGVNEPESDLIAEWTDEPASILSAETIDMIAIDSLKFHNDRDLEPLQKEAFRIVLRYYGVTL